MLLPAPGTLGRLGRPIRPSSSRVGSAGSWAGPANSTAAGAGNVGPSAETALTIREPADLAPAGAEHRTYSMHGRNRVRTDHGDV